MSELWSPQQREWLQAMGHSVWSLAGTEPEPAEQAVASSGRGARAEAAALLQEPRAAREASPVRTRPQARADRLTQAVLRAAGRSDGDAQVEALLREVAPLRGNAAAKRALWPRLRALRRTTRGE